MFEDYCLSCGKELADGRAYCNDQCHSGDLTSPSLSEASSPFSSPHPQYAHGQDVPALVPSALGRALRAYTAHDRYSASSSSASSWSVLTDDDDDDDDQYSEYDPRELDPQQSSHALSYARRPSGTNNRSTFPHLHRRTSSASSVCLPQSAPGDASFDRFLDDDGYGSDLASSVDLASEDPTRPKHADTMTATAAPTKARRKRNRASLPAYFSMLTTAGSSSSTATALPPPSYSRASPISTSSGNNTLTRPSPPTPKLSLMVGLAALHTAPPSATTTHFTPRGRRHDSQRFSQASPSRSHSRSPSPARRRDSDEKVADWSSGLARERGRAVRRNSSPPAKMVHAPSPQPIGSRGRSGSGSGSRARTRGRARVQELDGPRSPERSPERPGFGHGRSGLVDRARRGADEWVGVAPGW
ncbi:hypothetical protein B0H11DRAFT_1702038 [Mycena galericulata]|nr:hypothetical protein B0H11DRAFT_1702038 [Mycena galericulata]